MDERYSNNEEFFADLHGLIDAWCERRCLLPLAAVLPAYTSFNGMTDGWIELLDALKASVLTREALLPKELAMVANLRKAAEDALQVSEIRR